MIRQYIGARYVPKFYENQQGDSTWTAGVAYEPLTIVTYNGNSYTSKKPVPASVGNPSANPAYWVSTGIYNTQVEQLRQEVEDIGQRKANINTFALYIGNSYAIGTDSNTGNGIYNRTKNEFDGSHLEYAGGSGFVNYDGDHITYLELMQRAVSDGDVDTDDVTHIVVISAMGDSRAYAAGLNVQGALTAFAAYARDTFPNLVDIIVTLAEIRAVADLTGNSLDNIYKVHKDFKTYCPINGMHYIGWIGWPCMYDPAYTLSDNYHPGTPGYEIISQMFKNCWRSEMQYQPFRWKGLGVLNTPENFRIEMIGHVHPDESYIIISFGATSAIPNTYAAAAAGDAVELSLPSGVRAIPWLGGESYWTSFNMNWSATGKQMCYRFELTNVGGTYALRGITRVALTGNKTELSATANVPINLVMHATA